MSILVNNEPVDSLSMLATKLRIVAALLISHPFWT